MISLKLVMLMGVFFSMTFFVYGIFETRLRKRSLLARLETLDIFSEGVSIDDIEMSKSFSERVVMPMMSKLGKVLKRFAPDQLFDRIEKKLILAGYTKTDPVAFLGMKGILAFAFGVVGVALMILARMKPQGMIVYALMFPAMGFILPDLKLSMVAGGRRREINDALPDLLDLLTVSVEAGLGFEQAMQHAGEKMTGGVSNEIKRFLKELRLGKKRCDALRNMADRVVLPDLSTFCAALIQADQLGVGISDVLRVQSDSMRQKRRQRAEESAMKAPLKLLFPLVFFILPTLFMIMLGPAVINIIDTFSKIAK